MIIVFSHLWFDIDNGSQEISWCKIAFGGMQVQKIGSPSGDLDAVR